MHHFSERYPRALHGGMRSVALGEFCVHIRNNNMTTAKCICLAFVCSVVTAEEKSYLVLYAVTVKFTEQFC